MAYSIDYKKRAAEYKDAGHTFGELREAFKIPPITCYGWKEKFQNGYFEQKSVRQRKRKIDREKLKQAVKEKPDAYLRELARQFGCTPQAVFMLLKLKITVKKRPLPTVKNQKRNGMNLQQS
jgi:transposase-like protein